MRKYTFILLAFITLTSLFSSCKKDETQAKMLANPVAPVLNTVPDIVLKRLEASNMLQFVGTKADFGFPASVTYNLEADLAGNNFANPILIGASKVDTFNISVTDLNTLLIRTLPLDVASAMELRVKASLTIEASGAAPVYAISEPKAVSITTYGPPTLSLTTAGTQQGVFSPTDNKKYSGFIYSDSTSFQFTNMDDGKVYGGILSSGTTGTGVLTENGPAMILDRGGYTVTVDLTDPADIKMTFTEVTICTIGSAVGGWGDADETRMVWGFSDHTWNITKTVVAGGIKFRTHGGWGHVNCAYRPDAHDLNNLYQSHGTLDNVVIEPDLGDSQDIQDIAPGKYDIKLFLETKPWKVVFTPAK
jgi:starch-binding outer membrane protein SusE/F